MDCRSTEIEMRFEENYFEFKHNGNWFDSSTLWSLITQLSRKGILEEDESIGKFGTGFITTHLVSEKVLVTGNFLEEDNRYKRFKFFLNRSGITQEDFLENLKKNLEQVDSILEIEDNWIEYNLNETKKTVFQYEVEKEKSVFLEKGKKEICEKYQFLLVFNQNLEQVKVNDSIYYKKSTEKIDDTLSIVTIAEKKWIMKSLLK